MSLTESFLSLFSFHRELLEAHKVVSLRAKDAETACDKLRWELSLAEERRSSSLGDAIRANDGAIAKHKEADEWRALFLAEKARLEIALEKRSESIELVADTLSARMLGRHIYNHAPLVDPRSQPIRRPEKIETARDAVRRETESFLKPTPPESPVIEPEEAKKTFEEALQQNA